MADPLILSLAHRCGAALTGNGGLSASLFLAGLAGGVSHCAGMCGPFVLSQVGSRLETVGAADMREWHRLTGAALIPYHLGRATTYAGLGFAAATAGGGLTRDAGFGRLSATLLLAAALFMLAMAVPALKAWWRAGDNAQGWWSRRLGQLASPLFTQPTGWRGYLLGVLLGFLPCGLLWGALAAAAAAGGGGGGALAMLAFTAGTVPGLLAVGLAGHLAGHRWRRHLLRYAPFLLVFNAGVLALLAWQHMASP